MTLFKHHRSWRTSALSAALVLVAGCGADEVDAASSDEDSGMESDSGEAEPLPPDYTDVLPDPNALGAQGIRRLTNNELRWAALDLLGIDVVDELALLPGDDRTPFDNDYTTQFPSEALVTGFDAFADAVAQRVVDDPSTRQAVVGCEPTGPDDQACLREFVARFGRLALRRPLSQSERDELVAFGADAVAADDFYVAVRMVVHALLQDLEFVYRVELGVPVPGVAGLHELGPHELATRLSFLLWGSVPDPELLDRAEAGDLATTEGVYAEAIRMLADPKADQQLQRLHAMWLDYDAIPAPGALPEKLRRETGALVRRVVLDERLPWTELLTFPETFIDAELGAHYGIAGADMQPAWIPYPEDSGRGGLLSHGSFLSGETNFGDTSPVLRGKRVMERLLCQEIPLPPPDVDSAEPPDFGGPDACKEQQFSMRDEPTCAGCHSLMDNVGFGLENYGPAGQWRDHDVDRPDCPIDGQGELPGVGAFSGPGELGALLASSGRVEACFVRHMYQLAVGRPIRTEDLESLERLTTRFEESEADLVALLAEYAASEAMRYRVVDSQ